MWKSAPVTNTNTNTNTNMSKYRRKKNGKRDSDFQQPRVWAGSTIVIDEEPWFVGKDVAMALGYSDPARAVYDHVDAEDKTSLVIQQSGSNYKAKTAITNESGVYALIFGSKLPTAKKFKHWVTSEVLPSIRKTGGYQLKKPDSYMIEDSLERAKRWMEEERERRKIAAELKVAKPLAEQTVRFVESGHLLGFRELARELNIKEIELNRILVEHGWKYKVGHKYKYRKSCITKGYMETKDSINEDTGWSGTCDKFTVKGRMEVERMVNNEIVDRK